MGTGNLDVTSLVSAYPFEYKIDLRKLPDASVKGILFPMKNFGLFLAIMCFLQGSESLAEKTTNDFTSR